MNRLKLSNEQLTALIRSGFAPQFLSLAGMMGAAVKMGAQLLYQAFEQAGMDQLRAKAMTAILEQVAMPEEALFGIANEQVSLDSIRSVLQGLAVCGAKRMYELLPPAEKDQANALFNNFFLPYKSPLHVEGTPGLLSFEEVVEIVISNTVTEFNYDSDPIVDMDGGWIRVRRPGNPEYLFSEDGAKEAVYDGKRLMMPDIQGFSCTFVFE